MTHSDNTLKTFAVELKTELPFWLIFLPAVYIIGVLSRPGMLAVWPLMLLLLLAIAAYSTLVYRLNSITVDKRKGRVELGESNLLRRQRFKDYPLNALKFTYRRGKAGIRSRQINICTLYLADKKVATIMPDRDGWTDDSVHELARGLACLGVPKKFTGYSFKDAEIRDL